MLLRPNWHRKECDCSRTRKHRKPLGFGGSYLGKSEIVLDGAFVLLERFLLQRKGVSVTAAFASTGGASGTRISAAVGSGNVQSGVLLCELA